MRLRLVVGAVIFFILAAVVLAGIMSGPGLFASRTALETRIMDAFALAGNGSRDVGRVAFLLPSVEKLSS